MEEEKIAANIAVRAALDSITEIMGENGSKIIFKKAGLLHIMENPPEYDWDPCIPITQQGKIYFEIANLLGLKGALSVWRRIGYTNIKYAVEIGHALNNLPDLEPNEKFSQVMENLRIAIGMGKLAAKEDGTVDFDVFDCNICEGYTFDRPICTAITGSVQYIADWSYGHNVKTAKEIKCRAKGDDSCYFIIEDRD